MAAASPDAAEMDRDAFNAFCGSLPGTSHVVQWGGADVWKVRGKVFAIGWAEASSIAVTFKCTPMSFEMLKDMPGMRPAPYLASRGMIWLQRTSAATLDDEALREYLTASWRIVASGLSRKLREDLGLDAPAVRKSR
jgi:predicted DNA-binding protein (MmcQ/YjbR family)